MFFPFSYQKATALQFPLVTVLPSVAEPGAEIKNIGSGSGSSFSSGSSSFLFTTDLKKLRKKIMVAEEVFVNWSNCKVP